MKRNALFGLLITFMFLFSAIPLVEAGTTGTEETIEQEENEQFTGIYDNVKPHYDVDELVEMGAATLQTVDVKDVNNPLASIYDLSWMERSTTPKPASSVWYPAKDENDDFSNATYLEDGDKITNNVTSTITGTTLNTNDMDYFQVNLTVDGINNTVDKLEVTIFSQDAVNKNASLATQAYSVNFLLQQYMDADYEVTGKHHGNTSKIVIVPDGDATLNFVFPIFLEFIAWNSTTINYTVEVDITQVSGGEMDGIFGGGFNINGTNKNSNSLKMNSVNRSHDFYDWYQLTDVLTDGGLDTTRGDEVRFSMRVDVATEERGGMFGYAGPGLYGNRVPTTTIMFMYLIWLNYTSQQLSIATIGSGSLPFAGILFGNDPVTVGFLDRASMVWFGCAPLQLWLAGSSAYPGAEGNAEFKYNLTTINAQIIPPNGPPSHNLKVQNYVFNEDEGPWMNLTDLDDHFSDPETPHNEKLRFEVLKVDADDEIQFEIDEETHMMSIKVAEDNWNSNGILSKFRIKCYDWGPNWVYNDGDDLFVYSNDFTVLIAAVNDDAYIDKVDLPAGSTENNHEPIHITVIQGQSVRSKKIWGRDNDTEDVNKLEYTHNASTESFSISVNGQYSFIPTNDDVGVTWIKVTVDDGHSPSNDDYCILVFHVTNRNDAPSLVSIEWRDRGVEYDNLDVEDEPTFRNVDEDIEVNFTVEAHDPDIAIGQPDKLTWNVGSIGWEAHLHPTNPMKAYLTYTPTNDDADVGVAETSLFVTDTQGKSSQEITVFLYVDNVNDKPVILTINGEVPEDGKITLDSSNGLNAFEDQPFVLTVEAEDIDPREDVSFTTNDPSWQQSPVLGNDFARNFTIIPNQDMVGTHSVRITVKDEDGSADTVLVTYEVVNTNDVPEKPRIRYDESVIRQTGNDIRFWADDVEDPDGDELTFTWDFGDGTIVKGEEVIHNWTNDNEYYVTLTVSDPYGGESSEEITIRIIKKPLPPPDPDLDTDQDGIPDIWEEEKGLNKLDPNDALHDPDRDSFTNLEEYEADTDPLDDESRPVTASAGEDKFPWLLVIVIVAVGIILIGAVIFFLFVVMSKPQPVVQQQMYGQELPGAAYPGLPPQQAVAGQQLAAPQQAQLPPAPAEEERPPEEDYLEGFMEQAHQEIQDSTAQGSEEENVWKPPVEEPDTDTESSQVDDLFADAPEPDPVVEASTEVTPALSGPPELPKMPDLPPPPKL